MWNRWIMTPDEDAVAARIELDAQGRLVPLTREKAAAAMRHFARQDPPSRFAVYRLHEDEHGFDGSSKLTGLGSSPGCPDARAA